MLFLNKIQKTKKIMKTKLMSKKISTLFLISVLTLNLNAQISIDSSSIVKTCWDCNIPIPPAFPGSIYIAVSGGVAPYNFSLTGVHPANVNPVTSISSTGITTFNQLCQDTFQLRISNSSGDTIYYNFSTNPPTPPTFSIDSVTVKADSTNNPDSGFLELFVTTNADSVFYKIREQNNAFALGTLGGWQDSTIFDSLPGGYSYRVFVDIYPKVMGCGSDTGTSVFLIYIPLACENDGFVSIAAPSDVCIGDVVTMFGMANPGSGVGNVVATEFWDFGDGNTYAGPSPVMYTYYQPGSYVITYSVTTTHGCMFFGFSPITVHDQPLSFFTQSNNGTGLFNFLDQSTPPTQSITSWLWDFGDGNTSTVQNPTHQYTATGSYYVCLSVANNGGCNDTYCDSVYYNSTVGITEQNSTALLIYPNPANDFITIENTSMAIDEIVIYDITGKTIKTILPKTNTTKVNVSDLSDGVYFIKISNNKQSITKKIIKN